MATARGYAKRVKFLRWICRTDMGVAVLVGLYELYLGIESFSKRAENSRGTPTGDVITAIWVMFFYMTQFLKAFDFYHTTYKFDDRTSSYIMQDDPGFVIEACEKWCCWSFLLTLFLVVIVLDIRYEIVTIRIGTPTFIGSIILGFEIMFRLMTIQVAKILMHGLESELPSSFPFVSPPIEATMDLIYGQLDDPRLRHPSSTSSAVCEPCPQINSDTEDLAELRELQPPPMYESPPEYSDVIKWKAQA